MSTLTQPSPERVSPPRGREEVRSAILEAAATLMAERGAAASLRDIAGAAGVNLGLIHRHFGNKSDLRRAVLLHLADEQRTRLERGKGTPSLAELYRAVQEEDRNWRILIRALMRGEPVTELQDRFPVVRRIIELALEAAGDDADDAEIRFKVAHFVAAGLGWLVLEPFLVQAAGLEAPVEELRARVAREGASSLGLPD